MKLNGRTLKRRLYGLASLPDRVARMRHFRGHGVHSPFVYELVRKVFMQHRFLSEEQALYEQLRKIGVAHRTALRLHNLAAYLGYDGTSFDGCEEGSAWCILTPTLGGEQTLRLVGEAGRRAKTVVVLHPYHDRERATLCRRLIEEHRCTSVDQRAYLLLFTNKNLPKQHYRI